MKLLTEKLDGIVLFDKPLGLSSHHAMKRVQRLFQAHKAGHTGSLDPLATGMLPVCFGEATKFSRFFLEANKAYAVTMRLGTTTTTGDSEGEPVKQSVIPSLIPEHFTELHQQFLGTHEQIPPMFSAIKHQGKPLYRLAREGKTIERQPRTVTIYHLAFDPLETNPFGEISFVVECSKGTYIRSLVEQMGDYLECGAHVIALRRLWVSPFHSRKMVTLSDLEAFSPEQRREQMLTISEILSPLMPACEILPEQGKLLQKGREIWLSPATSGWVSLLCEGKFLGVGERELSGLVRPKRLIEQVSSVPAIG